MKRSLLTVLLGVATVAAAPASGAAESPLAPYFRDLPEGTDPGTISRRITDQFLSSRPENYCPRGSRGFPLGYGLNRTVAYSVVSLWANALACARLDGDKAREEKLVRLFDAFLPGGLKNRCCPRPCHVDDSVFGVLPYEIYLGNRDPRCLAMGNSYADAQWTPPSEGTLAARDAAPAERQSAYWAKGYTPQTRLWIDDMYMITALQGQAFRATGKRAYIDRAAREMCFYLDELQLKDGPAAGLFYHAPDVKYVWGRGAGWMAAGMALVLDRLPPDSGYRARIKRGYRLMMAALLKYQRDDGLWSQLVDRPDDPRNWGETSCTAMFAYAFMTGVARGWLDPAKYGPAARKAWDALCARLDDFANVSDVCIGTGKKDDLQYYFDRPRVNGDPHGQAPMLWMASVLLETKSGVVTGLRTPATSRLFEKRIDPVSGVVSWALSGGVATNVQSQYFTSKTMTDDGRFLLVDLSQNERILDFDAKGRPRANPPANRKYAALVDFLKDELIPMPDVPWQIPFIDTKDDYMVYSRDRAFYRRDFRDPSAERRLCAFPPEIRDSANRGGYPYTHLTLTPDRKKAFLDSCLVRADGTTNYVQGVVELATGKYTSWGRTDFFANHGQMNPARGDLAMCAWEACWKTPDAKAYRAAHDDRYPRMWLVRPDGSREMVPPVANYAVHEIWDDDGRGFSWCGRGVWHQSLDAPLGRQQEQLCPDPRAWHCRLSADNAYVVYDATPCATWRGSPWAVRFFNRATKRTIEVFSARPALLPRWHESRKHPDPHPHFSGDGRWVISTANNARGNMEVYLTSVDQLVARTTMAPPTVGTTVIVENPLGVVRGAETVSVKWKDLGLRPGDASVRVWDVAACAPVAYQDDAGRGALIFSTEARPLQPKERREYRILSDASLPQADLSIVCWSQHLPERMDDFAWENDRFGARAYGPVIMEPPPRGQALVSSGVDVLNKCVSYPVLHRWLVEDPDRGAYHRDRGEGMDVYNVGLGRGCGGLGAVDATNAWAFSRNWSKARMIQCGPVRTEFELTYPAWGGFGEETRRVTLDRGQHFAHCRVAFKGAAPAGVRAGPGLDCGARRKHNGAVARDDRAGWIANWEPANAGGPHTGSIGTAILLDPGDAPATSGQDALGCRYLFPPGGRASFGYWAGAAWSGASEGGGLTPDAKTWHKAVRDFANALRAPLKVICEGPSNKIAESPSVRELVAPTRVVWTSASGVSRAENLLKPKLRQVPEASWVVARANDASCVLANGGAATNGAAPAVLLDFGRELHGGLRISVSARSAKSARVRVRFGESVAEAMSELGERGACNDHAIRDSEILLPKMGSREIGNTGFRFVRIDFVTPGELALESVLAVSVMRGDLPAVGAFKSSDERLNRVFDTAVRTAALCCQDYVWDGIKRDRLVWAGDLHPETMTILSVFGAAPVLRDSLDYMMALTDAETGWMNGSFPTYTLWWLRNCAEWYRFTGDAKFLADRLDYIEKTFDHVATLVKDGEGWTSATVHGCFLDWPTHGDPVAERAGAQALALMTARDVAFLGREAGRTRLVEKAEAVAAKLARLRPDPHGAKSSAALLALGGLRDAREMFDEVLGKGGHAGVSTFYGYYMLEAMSAAGEGQRALDTVRDYWGAMLDVGATSFWEDFDLAWTNGCFRIDELPVAGKKDIHGDYGNYCYKGFRHSLCHGWSSGPAAWCVNRVLGIRPLAPGCRRVEVKPCLGDLDWAEGAMALPTGEKVAVKVRRRADGSLATEVSAPAWVEIDETAMIQSRIDACAAAGGGRVVVPAGRHLVGQLELRSNVELNLAKGAVLEGKTGLENYRVLKLPCSEGTWSAVVSGVGVTNVAVTGDGEIFGNGGAWNPPAKARDAIGCSEGLRPRGLFFADSSGIRLEDFLLRDAACWGIVFKRCADVVARAVRVDSVVNANNDGFDVEARDVLIERCDVNSGDDAYCIKSNDPNFVVENVVVRDCVARTHCNALKLGTASHGTMRNIRFENCRVEAPTRVYRDLAPMPADLSKENPVPGAPTYLCGAGISAICVECVDGGTVEDILFDGIDVSGCQVPVFVRGGRRMSRACGIPPGDRRVLRDVVIRRVRGRAESEQPSTITGVAGCRPQNIRLEDVSVVCRGGRRDGAADGEPGAQYDGSYPESNMFRRLHLPAYGLYVQNADAVSLKNVRFDLRPDAPSGESRPPVFGVKP